MQGGEIVAAPGTPGDPMSLLRLRALPMMWPWILELISPQQHCVAASSMDESCQSIQGMIQWIQGDVDIMEWM